MNSQNESYDLSGKGLGSLGELENALPAPLKKASAARAVLLLTVIVSVFGIGGAKLHGQYNDVQNTYTATDKYGHSMQDDLATQADAAANLIRQSEKILSPDSDDILYAKDALADWNEAAKTNDPSKQYQANKALSGAVDTLFLSSKATTDDLATIQGLYDEFLSCQSIIERSGASYNNQVKDYQDMTKQFPANVLGFLWGCSELSEFANN